ncbi:Uncharacterised protein [Bordetella pertussis]|nr:Uncharacterised protein [Bordetella pertussis]
MLLVVAHGGGAGAQLFDGRAGVETDHAVGVAVSRGAVGLRVQRHAHGDAGVGAPRHLDPGVPDAGGQLVLETS